MSLSKIRILQIGDLHLPSVLNERLHLDDKDKSFPTDLKTKFGKSPTKTVYKKIYDKITLGSFDAVLFMGDLTDKGDLDGFNGATQFIAESLQLGKGRRNGKQLTGIVPGNHDINRNLASQPDITEKFRPLNEALSRCGLPLLPVNKEVLLEIESASARARVIQMNSCWGCGAREFIPEHFREIISSAIDELLSGGGANEFSQYYDRQLDTPAFSSDTIQRVSQGRRETSEDTVEIYVAHHNLLPQRLSRLAPYTELVNSGGMRSTLTDGMKPTIYLHGHIHEDPIEIIKVPGGSDLIIISAPLSSDGFNEIEIVFTETGIPLTCTVLPWRFNKAGILSRSSHITMPLISGRRRSRDASIPDLLAFILKRREVYWSDIDKHYPPFYHDQN